MERPKTIKIKRSDSRAKRERVEVVDAHGDALTFDGAEVDLRIGSRRIRVVSMTYGPPVKVIA